MGKMFNTLVLAGIFGITLFLFEGTASLGVIGQLFLGPQTNWGEFLKDALLSGLGIATLTGAAIIVGAIIIRMDWIVRAGMFVILLSWVEAPFIAMWQFVGGKIVPLSNCTGSWACYQIVNGASTPGMIISGLIMGPLVLYAMWACFNYIWAPESSG